VHRPLGRGNDVKVCPTCYEVYAVEASYCPADGTALSTSDDRYLGRTVASRYRLVRRLGQGGMSQVYLAKHVIIDRMSAIKILRSDLGTSGAYRERFLREARAVNRINHRNIVEISDVGEADGIAYLVMEYVEGTTLLEHIQRGPMPWPRALRIAAQIASALGRAHQLGVIHRDLKPENVMVLRGEDDL
jgi:serine/threonine protein kinase